MADTPTPPPPTGGAFDEATNTRPWWKRKRVIIPAVLVVLIVIAGIAGGDTDDDTSTATDTTTAPDDNTDDGDAGTGQVDDVDEEEPTTTTEATTTTAPPAEGIGAVFETGSGGLARLNSVTPNAEPSNEFATPAEGTTFTRIDVEVCAGDDGQQANPLYWNGGLDDNTDATAALGAQSYETVGLAQGECQRGTVDLEVPDGRSLASVYLTSPGLSEIARWDLSAPPVEVTGPLSPTDPPSRLPLGETANTSDGPSTAYSVTDGAEAGQFVTVPPGTTLSRLDVEVCAGEQPRAPNPLYWYAITEQNRWLAAELGAQNFESGEIAPGQCRRGTVDVAVPDGDRIVAVAVTDPGQSQIAGWSR